MSKFLLILMLAITVEALVQYLKTILQTLQSKEYKTAMTQAVAIAISVLLCFATGADFYSLLGVVFAFPWLGIVLTGIFISRGSNYVADFIKRLQNPVEVGDIILDGVADLTEDK